MVPLKETFTLQETASGTRHARVPRADVTGDAAEKPTLPVHAGLGRAVISHAVRAVGRGRDCRPRAAAAHRHRTDSKRGR